ncbi:hypothetical protein J6590_083171 [Homalodisca vitripennis]|nr:hypothetical protein J6590_083171 [Homalodisca vitripennis]
MLAASSTVSVGWRGCFNQNWMWWQHCNADTAEYLEAAECRVDPRFKSPESEDSTQTLLYMKAGNKEISIRDSLVAWSGCFKQSWMWWPHCNADTAEVLETAECRVDPKFESPQSEDSTQTCLYKKAGNKKITIKESL